MGKQTATEHIKELAAGREISPIEYLFKTCGRLWNPHGDIENELFELACELWGQLTDIGYLRPPVGIGPRDFTQRNTEEL